MGRGRAGGAGGCMSGWICVPREHLGAACGWEMGTAGRWICCFLDTFLLPLLGDLWKWEQIC